VSAPSRRTVLAGSAALAVAAIPTAVIALQSNPDAELIAACKQHSLNIRAYNRSPEDDTDPPGPLWSAYETTRDLISEAVPQTLAGVIAKAKAAAHEARGLHGEEAWGGSMGERWSQDIAKDLLRITGNRVAFEPHPEEDSGAQPFDQPHPDLDLIKAAKTFVAAEAEYAATHWADDDLDPRPDDRAAAKARLVAADAAQNETATVLVERVATTLAGYQSKAKAAVAWYGAEPPNDGIGADILWSLAQDLVDLA